MWPSIYLAREYRRAHAVAACPRAQDPRGGWVQPALKPCELLRSTVPTLYAMILIFKTEMTSAMLVEVTFDVCTSKIVLSSIRS